MKKTSKILITILLVISMLVAFCIMAFALNTNDIIYNDVTYPFDNKYIQNTVIYIQFENKNNVKIIHDNQEITSTYDYNRLKVTRQTSGSYDWRVVLYNNNTLIDNPSKSSSIDIYFYYTGNITIKTASTGDTTYDNATEISQDLYPNYLTYSIWRVNSSFSNGMYIVNQNEENMYDKIDSFITYLQTSLTSITTLILGSQVLMLFIVSIPIISFVVGAFKRFKDAGRL